MNKKTLLARSAYLVGSKLAQIDHVDSLTEAILSASDNQESKDNKVNKLDSMTGDDQYKSGDTWGHSREITLPSNMGVPSR